MGDIHVMREDLRPPEPPARRHFISIRDVGRELLRCRAIAANDRISVAGKSDGRQHGNNHRGDHHLKQSESAQSPALRAHTGTCRPILQLSQAKSHRLGIIHHRLLPRAGRVDDCRQNSDDHHRDQDIDQ